MTFAVIKTGGKQYKVSEGDVLSVEKLTLSAGSTGSLQAGSGQAESDVIFEDVFLIADDKDVKIGKPRVAGAKVEAKVLEEGKGDKKMVFRYKSKTRYKKKKGHRQPFTKVRIVKILS